MTFQLFYLERNKPMNSCQADTSPHQKGSRDDSLNQYLEQEALSTRMSRIGHTILILSGKGGVGKSTVATNLAVELAASGKVVGLLDVDIHGPSIPKLLGLEGRSPVSTEQGILPIEYDKRLKVMSIAFLLPDRDNAVIWRGPLKMNMIKQFLKDVEWGDLDYLVVDCPPGTGDEPLSVVQLIGKPDGAIIVTTPQNLAIVDVRKCVCFCQQLAVPVLGVIENMSRFICPHCGEAVDIFKSGGGEAMASDMHIPFLGRIPIDPDIVQASDCGEPYIRSQAQSAAAAAFRDAIVPVLQMTRRS
jgi:ATP-binding protein involved in chromosome partitioning